MLIAITQLSGDKYIYEWHSQTTKANLYHCPSL